MPLIILPLIWLAGGIIAMLMLILWDKRLNAGDAILCVVCGPIAALFMFIIGVSDYYDKVKHKTLIDLRDKTPKN